MNHKRVRAAVFWPFFTLFDVHFWSPTNSKLWWNHQVSRYWHSLHPEEVRGKFWFYSKKPKIEFFGNTHDCSHMGRLVECVYKTPQLWWISKVTSELDLQLPQLQNAKNIMGTKQRGLVLIIFGYLVAMTTTFHCWRGIPLSQTRALFRQFLQVSSSCDKLFESFQDRGIRASGTLQDKLTPSADTLLTSSKELNMSRHGAFT